jgi:hypothetical protein
MDFLQTVLSVLNGDEYIPVLSEGGLYTHNLEGEIIAENLPIEFVAKIARLRTLIHLEAERSDIHDERQYDLLDARHDGSAHRLLEVSVEVLDDSTNRQLMLEGLIIEVVRQFFPSECEHLSVRYTLTKSFQLVRAPFPRPCRLKS